MVNRHFCLPVLFASVLLAAIFMAGRYSADGNKNSLPSELFATASCIMNGNIMATGNFDNNAEAVYFLNNQSSRLSAALLSRSEATFNKLYTRLIKADLEKATKELKISMPVAPQYMMVTGNIALQQVGAMDSMSKSFLYVAELNTGIVFVYALPTQGDRDLAVNNGEIIFWTYVRMGAGIN